MASSEYSLSINIDNVDFTLSVSKKGKRLSPIPLLFSGFETTSSAYKNAGATVNPNVRSTASSPRRRVVRTALSAFSVRILRNGYGSPQAPVAIRHGSLW